MDPAATAVVPSAPVTLPNVPVAPGRLEKVGRLSARLVESSEAAISTRLPSDFLTVGSFVNNSVRIKLTHNRISSQEGGLFRSTKDGTFTNLISLLESLHLVALCCALCLFFCGLHACGIASSHLFAGVSAAFTA